VFDTSQFDNQWHLKAQDWVRYDNKASKQKKKLGNR